jgi:type I restriction enzyme, R subunit
MPWRTIEGETLAPATMPQLEVLLRGVFDKRRFLDLIRHFIMFSPPGTPWSPAFSALAGSSKRLPV